MLTELFVSVDATTALRVAVEQEHSGVYRVRLTEITPSATQRRDGWRVGTSLTLPPRTVVPLVQALTRIAAKWGARV